jgi:hypothetical protein
LFNREVTRYVSLECVCERGNCVGERGKYVGERGKCVGERGKLPGNMKNMTFDMAACSTAKISGNFREIFAPIIKHEDREGSFSMRL